MGLTSVRDSTKRVCYHIRSLSRRSIEGEFSFVGIEKLAVFGVGRLETPNLCFLLAQAFTPGLKSKESLVKAPFVGLCVVFDVA